jgi:hypothetical protein
MEVGWLLMSGNKRYLVLVSVINVILNGVDTQQGCMGIEASQIANKMAGAGS